MVLTRRYSVFVILILMYIIPLLLVLIQSFRKLTQVDDYHVVFNRYTMFCSFVRHSKFQHLVIVKKFGVVSLCAAIVGFSYARIYFLVRHRGRRLSGSGGSFNHVRLHRELSLLKTVIGIFLTFTASYLPITVVYGLDRERTLPHEVYFVGVVLMWVSPSINWIVYGLMNDNFARAYRHCLCAVRTSAASRLQRPSLGWPSVPLSTKPAAEARRHTNIPCLRGSDRMMRERVQRAVRVSEHACTI